MNVVIVEDSELVRTQLLRLLALRAGVNVTGVATTEETAVSLITATNPDAILLDLALAPGSGIRVLERIRNAGCATRVLILTNNTGEILQQACVALGISGFYDKSNQIQACMDLLFSWLTPSSVDDASMSAAYSEPKPDSGWSTDGYPGSTPMNS